jgi:hypothetical protein
MYTLTEVCRKKENISFHRELGDYFSIIERETSPKEFERAFNAFFNKDLPELKQQFQEKDIEKDVYCLLVTAGGRDILPLRKDNFYYIVTENGKTFKNLTFK